MTGEKRIACITLGCKVNEYDTQAMRESFERHGWKSVPFDEEADVYLVNTCTVTSTGDSKSLKTIRRAAREHPKADIIVTGCLAQKDADAVKLPGVRVVIGSAHRSEIYKLYERSLQTDETVCAVGSLKNTPFEKLTVTGHEDRTRAVLKIQEGCDRFCTYCIIPFVRGPVRSMPIEDIEMEAARLASAGYAEIVLTGIHMASYGRDSGATLADAINAACRPEGVRRVRLGSLEPVTVTDEFIEKTRGNAKLCPQFHLALQSGSADILRAMRRRYTPDEYREAVARLREAFPGCAITTDVLCGFPGETEEHALETEDFIREIGFARIHVFPYSRREGTVADRMEGQLPEHIKHERAKRLIEIGNKLEEEYVSKQTGTEQEVIFETCGSDGLSEGYTASYVHVRADGRPGEIRKVLITGHNGKTATGKVI